MVRFVHVKMTGGRAKTSTHARVADALDHAQRIGGCVHRVVYGSRGVVTSMRKVGCYSGGSAFAGVYTGASNYPGHYWKSGHGYVACPKTPAAKKRASKAVKKACSKRRG